MSALVPAWAEACLLGLAAGAGLLLGAAGGYFLPLPHRTIAAIMAFGGGVLLSVLAFELVEDAVTYGGIGPTVAGVFGGAALFSTVTWQLSRYGARHRKRCGECVRQPTEAEVPGSGLAIAVVGRFAPWSVGVSIALAGGGVLAMLAETMIPEAFEKVPSFIGLITVRGFLLAFTLTRLVL